MTYQLQRSAVWHQLHRRPPGEHQSADGRRPAGQLPAALSGVRRHRGSPEHRRHGLQLPAGAAQPAVHQGPPVRVGLHAGEGVRQARHQPVRRGGPGLVLARAHGRHAAAQPDHQLHLGCAGRQQVVGQRADSRRARRVAALGQHGVRLGRLGRRGLLDDGQLRLLRRRRRRSHRPDGRRSDERRQSRSESRWHGLVREPGRVRASVRPAGSRQCPGAVHPAAVDQEHGPVVVQELPDGRLEADPDPLGDVQRVQHGELVGHQPHRAVQPGR